MHFTRLTEHDADDLMKFIAADLEAVEPLVKSLSLGKEDALAFLKSLLREAIDSGVSYLVRTDDHKIIAARLSTFRTREESLRDTEVLPRCRIAVTAESERCVLHLPFFSMFNAHFTSQFVSLQHNAFHDFKTELERAKSLLWHLNQQFWADVSPDIDKVYYLMAVVVEQQFRYTDLVDRLIHYNMDEVRTMGAQGLLANAAIFHNDSLLHRLGYRVMAEASHDFVFNSGGRHLFQNNDNSNKAQLVFKEVWRDESLESHIVV